MKKLKKVLFVFALLATVATTAGMSVKAYHAEEFDEPVIEDVIPTEDSVETTEEQTMEPITYDDIKDWVNEATSNITAIVTAVSGTAIGGAVLSYGVAYMNSKSTKKWREKANEATNYAVSAIAKADEVVKEANVIYENARFELSNAIDTINSTKGSLEKINTALDICVQKFSKIDALQSQVKELEKIQAMVASATPKLVSCGIAEDIQKVVNKGE